MSTPNPIFDRNFFDKPEAQAKSRMNEVMGGIGLWLLHFTKIGLLAYTSYHGIHAALMYAGDNPLATIFQIFGFVVIEATLLGLYIAWLNKMLLGVQQRVAAFAVYVVCLLIACFGVLVDSQLALLSIEQLPPLSNWYLLWGLPFAPLLAGVGGAIVHALDPDNLAEQAQERAHREHQRALQDTRFTADIRQQEAALEVNKTVANMQLASRLYVASVLHETVKQPWVIQKLQTQALRDLPTLLNAAGIDIGAYNLPNAEMPATDLLTPPANTPFETHKFNFLDNSTPTVTPPASEPTEWTVDTLAQQLGMSTDELASLIQRLNVASAPDAFKMLQQLAPLLGFTLPDTLDEAAFGRIYANLPTPSAGEDFLAQP